MAIWQYTFHVLPMESLEALPSDYCLGDKANEFDDEPYWKLNPNNKDLFRFIQGILPKNKSWSNEVDLYGYQDSNCFEVLSDSKGNVISVAFRIDFRNSYENVLRQIIEFCILNGLVILNEDLKQIPRNFEQAQSIIEDSIQVKKYYELSQKDKLE